jgi:hypothetical protein
VVQRILGSCQATDERGRATVQAATMNEICVPWGKEAFYKECQLKYNRLSHKRKIQEEDENGIYKMDVTFAQKRLLKNNHLLTPKCILVKHCVELYLPKPTYESVIHFYFEYRVYSKFYRQNERLMDVLLQLLLLETRNTHRLCHSQIRN